MSTAEIALVVSGVATLFGAFGAVNAHRALRWQRRRDEERTATRVRLDFEHATWHEEDLPPAALALIGGPENLPLEYRLTLIAVNESEAVTVYVRDLYIEEAEGPHGVHLTYDEDDDTRLEPRQRMSRHLFLERSNIDPSRGLVGKARLATDEWVESEVEHLLPELLEDVNERNARGRGELESPNDEGIQQQS